MSSLLFSRHFRASTSTSNPLYTTISTGTVKTVVMVMVDGRRIPNHALPVLVIIFWGGGNQPACGKLRLRPANIHTNAFLVHSETSWSIFTKCAHILTHTFGNDCSSKHRQTARHKPCRLSPRKFPASCSLLLCGGPCLWVPALHVLGECTGSSRPNIRKQCL